jgi:cell cycle sensor histidine kinase DivJ
VRDGARLRGTRRSTLRNSAAAGSFRAYLDALVHPDARADALLAERHRAFFATKLLGGLAVLAVIPVYLAMNGAPSALEALIFAWVLTPLLLVAYLSKTGRFERAHILSACALASLIAAVGAGTGGLASFVTVWLVVLPFEASLSSSRRVIGVTVGLAATVLAGLWSAEQFGLIAAAAPAGTLGMPVFLGTLSAAAYAGVVALANSSFVRAGHQAKSSSEARYRLLAQNMSDVIARHGRDGALSFVSPAAEQLTGVPAAQLMGHQFFDRVHVADRPAFLTAIAEAATSGEPVSVEYRLRRDLPDASADFVWVEMRCRAIDIAADPEAKGPRQIVSVMRDISARKTDALALESARADAERASEAKGRFLATMSHELRTPLNAIIGFSEMLTREQELKLDASRRQEYARLIRDSGEHLLGVVNGILDMSRIEAGHFEVAAEPFSLQPLIESCRQMMSLRAEQAGIQLFAEIPERLPQIKADPRALRQIVINLVSNAIKFTERGGKVDIAARASSAEFELTVTDTGVGIPDSDLARLGDPFFQVRSTYDRDHEGTGLGLSVVMGLVKLHGGTVEIESRLRQGTKVSVRLPLDCQRSLSGEPRGRISRFPVRAPHPAADEARLDANTRVRKSA